MERKTVEYVDAGHGLAYIARDGELTALEGVDGLWLGVEPDRSYQTREVSLDRGSRLIVISDGIVEQPGADGSFFGGERLAKAVQGSASVRTDVDRLLAAVIGHAPSATPRDDVTAASFAFADDPPRYSENTDQGGGNPRPIA